MGKMQRAKGTRFENLVIDLIISGLHAFAARNQRQTGDDAGRDLWLSLPFCVQCSHSKAPSIRKKFREAKQSARGGEAPVAITRRNYGPILVTMDMGDWVELVARAFCREKEDEDGFSETA